MATTPTADDRHAPRPARTPAHDRAADPLAALRHQLDVDFAVWQADADAHQPAWDLYDVDTYVAQCFGLTQLRTAVDAVLATATDPTAAARAIGAVVSSGIVHVGNWPRTPVPVGPTILPPYPDARSSP